LSNENQSSNGTILDIFVAGARRGWDIGKNSIAPNVVMAFVLIHLFKVIGLLDLIGRIFAPIMGIFGLPGEAMAGLAAGWLSMGGGIGVSAALYADGLLNGTHLTIMIVGIYLAGAQIQYMGRLLGVAEIKSRFYPHLLGLCILNAIMGMLVMRFLIGIVA